MTFAAERDGDELHYTIPISDACPELSMGGVAFIEGNHINVSEYGQIIGDDCEMAGVWDDSTELFGTPLTAEQYLASHPAPVRVGDCWEVEGTSHCGPGPGWTSSVDPAVVLPLPDGRVVVVVESTTRSASVGSVAHRLAPVPNAQEYSYFVLDSSQRDVPVHLEGPRSASAACTLNEFDLTSCSVTVVE